MKARHFCLGALLFSSVCMSRHAAHAWGVVDAEPRAVETRHKSLPEQETQRASARLFATAQAITVKVLAGDTWGSGTIVQHTGSQYLVITNAHVTTPAIGRSLRIQTEDGRLHRARVLSRPTAKPIDLALLAFNSLHTYPMAIFKPGSFIAQGLAVYSAGFPFDPPASAPSGFVLLPGRTALIPVRVLTGGYQIGSTNQVQKGMSGGPLLSEDGEVVAINAMHAYPLWGNPYVYEDGTLPTAEESLVMRRLSWGIPVQRIRDFLVSSSPRVTTLSRKNHSLGQ